MSSPWKTGHMSEALEALPEIIELARNSLSKEEFIEANGISEMLVGSKTQRLSAKKQLISLIARPPTRPLYYIRRFIVGLPTYTRDTIRYLGDYIDLLTKEMAYENVRGNSRRNSLGRNVEALRKSGAISSNLVDQLRRFNDFLYTPGKHDFSLPPGRKHRFTSKEAVLAIYVSINLGERIKSVSEFAKVAVEKDNLYMIGGRWGSKNRVVYAGEE